MTSLKVLSAAAALALMLPLAVPTASVAQDKVVGGGGGGPAIGGGGGRGGGGGGMAIGGGGGMRTGGGGGGGFAASPGFRDKVVGGGGGAVIGGGGGRHFSGGGQPYGGHGHRHHRGYGGFGTGLVIGGAVGSSYGYYGAPGYGYYDDGYYDEPVVAVSPGGDDVEYCRRTYRSYDVRSGTYLGYDGLRHACP